MSERNSWRVLIGRLLAPFVIIAVAFLFVEGVNKLSSLSASPAPSEMVQGAECSCRGCCE